MYDWVLNTALIPSTLPDHFWVRPPDSSQRLNYLLPHVQHEKKITLILSFSMNSSSFALAFHASFFYIVNLFSLKQRKVKYFQLL